MKSRERKLERLTIDHKHHKGLIGPNGRTVQKLIVDAGGPEDRSIQARIVRFPRQGDDSDKIVLSGPPALVDKIAEKFLEFAARETIEMDVPSEKLSRIIGTGGKKRMELEGEFDVIIYVPQVNRGHGTGLEKIKITGRPEQNEKAKKAIQVCSLKYLANNRTSSRLEMVSQFKFLDDYIIDYPTTDGLKTKFDNDSKSTFPMTALKSPNHQKVPSTGLSLESTTKKKHIHGTL